jgi:hypothetical protein
MMCLGVGGEVCVWVMLVVGGVWGEVCGSCRMGGVSPAGCRMG